MFASYEEAFENWEWDCNFYNNVNLTPIFSVRNGRVYDIHREISTNIEFIMTYDIKDFEKEEIENAERTSCKRIQNT